MIVNNLNGKGNIALVYSFIKDKNLYLFKMLTGTSEKLGLNELISYESNFQKFPIDFLLFD